MNASLSQSISRSAALILRVTLYILLLAPIVIFLLHAFSTRWFFPQVLPTEWTIEPFLRQIDNPRIRSALAESLWIALLSSGLSIVVGYPAARTLGTYNFRGKGFILLFLFLPTVVPPIVTGLGLNILFLRIGLAGTTLGVVLVHLIPVLPYAVFTLSSVFSRYDPNYEHQAMVLGAGRWRIFWTVTLPLIFPGVVVATLFAFLISWSQYLLTFLIGGGRIVTLPILLFSTVSGGNPTTIAILSLIFIAPPIIVIIAVSRYLTSDGLLSQTGRL
ncbi:MAG: hypothetical protein GFH27_549291n76 [Chloroflexi bacterium AL-W]|nr:hypothetical protein [Chloroflexi bacterium AL-N1]NOK67457.1 hypothetical protein [Chloroflexi bacterium AL-N10]NOK75051.1 hypothetical protein [Chloroflexi bacterium AL-N5]NOK81838.1 hypothetical protein [Chloroflexi bacterium AL-W]NOK89684.1 hypothetical protein [Chloroflexi bacterium AL-N15]